MRTRSPSRAPPEKGDDGSTARIPTRFSARRSSPTRADVDVDLPTPGAPVMPTILACPACGTSVAVTSLSRGDSSSTREISRATARGSPSRARETRSVTTLPSSPSRCNERREATSGGNAEDQRITLTAATAQRRDPDTATAALELEREVKRDPGPRHPDGVSECDGAAVDVHPGLVQAEGSGRVDADGGERLV